MTLRLVHLSDIHFGGENRPALVAVAAWIAEHRPDLAVITGDVTREGAEREFTDAITWTRRLSVDSLVLPGNHDTPYFSLLKRLFAPWNRYERHFGATQRLVQLKAGVAIATINTARGVQLRTNWSKGAISTGQVRDAIRALDTAPAGALKVVACHHPLVEMLGGPMSGEVHGGHDAALAFSAARVDLVLTGHVHAPFALPYPGGDGRTWAVGASTLSLRERGMPIGFNCIEIEDLQVRVTALAWTGSHFETWRTWTIDRRAVDA